MRPVDVPDVYLFAKTMPFPSFPEKRYSCQNCCSKHADWWSRLHQHDMRLLTVYCRPTYIQVQILILDINQGIYYEQTNACYRVRKYIDYEHVDIFHLIEISCAKYVACGFLWSRGFTKGRAVFYCCCWRGTNGLIFLFFVFLFVDPYAHEYIIPGVVYKELRLKTNMLTQCTM